MIDFILAVIPKSGLEHSDSFSMKLENMKVIKNPWSIGIQGSLTKLAIGHNAQTIGADTLRLALDRIREQLGTDFLEAKVVSMEIGLVIEVDYPVSEYLPLLLAANRSQRTQFDETSVSFSNRRSRIVFYDKGAEMKKSSTSEENINSENNLMRIEWKMRKRITNQIGRELFLKDFYDMQVLQMLLRRLMKKYDDVRKPAEFIPLRRPKKLTAAGVVDALLHDYLEKDGIADVNFKLASLTKNVDSKNAYRAKKQVLYRMCSSNSKRILFKEELDKKFNEQCLFLFQSCNQTREDLK